MKRKGKIILGSVILGLGILCIIIGVAANLLIKSGFKSNILEQDIVTGKDSPNYPRWIRNDFPGAPIMYEGFYMYNMTNYHDVLNNKATPQVEEVGPYYYREFHERIGVSWNDDQTQFTYWDYAHWNFLPEKSEGRDPLRDIIYNVNPAYVGAVYQAGNDLELTIGLTGGVLNDYMKFLTTTFVDDILAQNSPSILLQVKQQLQQNHTDEWFFSQWANATKPPSTDPLWAGMLEGGTVSGISNASAQMLFEPNTPYSLANTSPQSIQKWSSAVHGDKTDTDFLKDTFMLTAAQIRQLLTWFSTSYKRVCVEPLVKQKWKINDVTDLAYIQWGQGTVTNYVSVRQLYPEMNFTIPPEYALWWYYEEPVYIPTLSLETSKKLLNGTEGLIVPIHVGDFFKTVETRNWTAIENTWGLTELEVAEFTVYFMAHMYEVADPLMRKLATEGGGLITGRTVHQWLWDAVDPLLQYMQPSNPNARLSRNYTSPEDTFANQEPSICYTGKDDYTKIMEYIQVEGQKELNIYAKPIKVGGTTEEGQFQPFLGPYTHLQTWNKQYRRRINLIPTDQLEVQGITVQRYMIDNMTLQPNPDFYQSVPGFANMTSAFHSPIFMGNPHMFLADPKWREKIKGMKPTNPNVDQNLIDVEPNLGKDAAPSPYFYYNPSFSTGIIYPIMWAFEQEEVSDELADEIKDKLYTALKFESIAIPVFVPIGALLAVAGAVILFMGIRNFYITKYPYTSLNTDEDT